jgi:hypothetical protein
VKEEPEQGGDFFQTLETDPAQKGFSMVRVETALWPHFPALGSEIELEVDAGALAGRSQRICILVQPPILVHGGFRESAENRGSGGVTDRAKRL